MAGYSLTGSVASSYLGHQRLEVKTFLKRLQDYFIPPRLERTYTQERSFLFPVKDLARPFPSGWLMVSLILVEYHVNHTFSSVKNRQQSHWLKMEQAQELWQAVS